MKRPFHPLLFAAYPVLALYSANQGLVPINQVFLPLVLVGGCVVTLWALGSLLFRNAARAALVASAAVTGFFLYGHLRTATNLQEQSALLLWFPLYALLIAASAWKWKDVDRLTPALNAVAILLFAFPLATIALGGAKSRAGVEQPFSAPLKQNRPDIIHIVLDGYGRSDSLRKVMRYDNSAFLEALRKRGFQVLPRARANYVQTEQSLSSALNLNYVQHLFPEAQPSSMDRALLDNAIDRSLVSMRLRAIGYTYVAITTGFPFISFRSADLVLGERSGNALFLSSLLNLTPLPESSWTSESQYEIKRKAVHSAFANIAELSAPSRTPKFIFAHILMPHPPFVFGPNGEAAPQRRGGNALSDGSHYMSRGGTPDTYRSGYVGQITYLNKVVIETLDKVLKQAKPDSIIIIHGDHGSKLGLDQDSLSKTDIVEVAPILMAVKGPLMPDNLSPVNLYRIIFSDVFGDPWSELPSHTYYSTWEKPYVYHDVTNRVP